MAFAAGPFAAPQEGPVAFRRDRLPIDVDTITGLSADLVTLSQGQRFESAADRRVVAQMLALALALNPANAEARGAVTAAAKGAPLGKAGRRELEHSRTRIWAVLKWLGSPDANADGRALGACLGDVIAMADPTNRDATPLLEAGEKGAWKPWVAEVVAFETAQPIVKEGIMGKDSIPAPKDEPKAPPAEAKLVLGEASLFTPLWQLDKATGAEQLQVVKVEMKAAIQPPPAPEAAVVKPMTFAIDFTPENGPVNRMNRSLHAVLAKHYGTLPAGSQVVFNLGEEAAYLPTKDRDALSGAAAVLMGAALSGKAPAGFVIGTVEADGSFRTLPDLWERLRALSGGPGGRLVIPAEAADLMPWILALEDSEFFLKYDVLLASNYQELVERSAVVTASPLTEILARFQDVRSKGTGLPLGQYVTNRFVRQRLVELAGEASYFVSPKLLMIQGAGERPVRIPKKILAHELRSAIQPVAWVRSKAAADIDLSQLDRSYDLARAQVDKLERYGENRELLVLVRETIAAVRTFSRAARISSTRDRGPVMMAEAFEEMKKSLTATGAELNGIIGEVDEAEPDNGQ